MRLSDILKKINEKTAGAPQPAPQPAAADSAVRNISVPRSAAEQSIRETVPAVKDESAATLPPVDRAAETVYTKTLAELKTIIQRIDGNTAYGDQIACVPELVALIEKNDCELISLADRATPDVYLYGHSANGCIYALLIGKTMGLDGVRLETLAYCALLHDLGMAKCLSSVLKSGKLSSAEFEQVKKHPQFGKEVVRLMPSLPADVQSILPDVVSQVHERANGSGYPSGKTIDDIHLFARIIAIADVYEALTHPRSYRDRYLPHEALKMMINTSESAFDTAILKSFIEQISLYPPGSYVRLNTDEIARVVSTNAGMPTRPRVRVITDAQLQRVKEAKTIDLNQTPMIFVKEAVDETKLAISDKKLLLELRARRWWVRGI